MFLRILLAVVALSGWSSVLQAAPDCTPSTVPAKSAEPLVDWYDTYIRPYRTMPGNSGELRLNKTQVEGFIEEMKPFHRSAVLDPLFFEALAQQISASYARAASFKGINTAAAEKIYKSGTGQALEFSLLCINARTVRAPDDAFGITLFGVPADDCQHVGLRGLVFTDTLVNGRTGGQCRPDQVFYKLFSLPLPAGTNDITFVCRKEAGGCARQ
jgi:hypothetical protein